MEHISRRDIPFMGCENPSGASSCAPIFWVKTSFFGFSEEDTKDYDNQSSNNANNPFSIV